MLGFIFPETRLNDGKTGEFFQATSLSLEKTRVFRAPHVFKIARLILTMRPGVAIGGLGANAHMSAKRQRTARLSNLFSRLLNAPAGYENRMSSRIALFLSERK
jgi:hypothetical protein